MSYRWLSTACRWFKSCRNLKNVVTVAFVDMRVSAKDFLAPSKDLGYLEIRGKCDLYLLSSLKSQLTEMRADASKNTHLELLKNNSQYTGTKTMNVYFKAIVVSLAFISPLSFAQSSSMSDGNGGYYHSDGSSSMSDGNGGYYHSN